MKEALLEILHKHGAQAGEYPHPALVEVQKITAGDLLARRQFEEVSIPLMRHSLEVQVSRDSWIHESLDVFGTIPSAIRNQVLRARNTTLLSPGFLKPSERTPVQYGVGKKISHIVLSDTTVAELHVPLMIGDSSVGSEGTFNHNLPTLLWLSEFFASQETSLAAIAPVEAALFVSVVPKPHEGNPVRLNGAIMLTKVGESTVLAMHDFGEILYENFKNDRPITAVRIELTV